MNKDEARKEIFKLYNTEYAKHIGGIQNREPVMGALDFYFWLKKYHPDVLAFPDDGDRYQTISCWIGETVQVNERPLGNMTLEELKEKRKRLENQIATTKGLTTERDST